MSIQRQLRRSTTSQINAMTPAEGEPLFDKTRKTVVVGDGSTAGGIVLPHYDPATGYLGVGTDAPGSKLDVYAAINDPSASISFMRGFWNISFSADSPFQFTTAHANPYINIAAGKTVYAVTGVTGANYINHAENAGTLQWQVGVQSQTGFILSASGARINNVFGFRADLNDQASGVTIDNAYGLFLAKTGDSGTIVNFWDIFAQNTGANNYIAGNLFVGGVANGGISDHHFLAAPAAEGSAICSFFSTTTSLNSLSVYAVAGTGANSSQAALGVQKSSTTSRSINAAGTVNASGADVAEYKTKRGGCGTISSGQVCGLDDAGLITDKWSYLINPRVKSGAKGIQPAVVMGDVWGSAEAICVSDGLPLGVRPAQPARPIGPNESEDSPGFAAKMAQFTADMADYDTAMALVEGQQAAYDARLEANRLTVDRLAYCGTVYVLLDQMQGEHAPQTGDYIVLCEGTDDAIAWEAVPVTDVTFSQTHLAIGRVERLADDGTPLVAVRV